MSSSKLPQLGVAGAGAFLEAQYLGIVIAALCTALLIWSFMAHKKNKA